MDCFNNNQPIPQQEQPTYCTSSTASDPNITPRKLKAPPVNFHVPTTTNATPRLVSTRKVFAHHEGLLRCLRWSYHGSYYSLWNATLSAMCNKMFDIRRGRVSDGIRWCRLGFGVGGFGVGGVCAGDAEKRIEDELGPSFYDGEEYVLRGISLWWKVEIATKQTDYASSIIGR